MEAPWLPNVLNMLEGVPCECPIVKDHIRDVFGRLGAQGSAIDAFNPLAVQRCVVQTSTLFLSLSGGGEHLKYLQQISTSSVGKNGKTGVLEGVPNKVISTPELAGVFFCSFI